MSGKKKILVLRNFTVEPILNELEDKLLKKNIKCQFEISTYENSISDVIKIKKKQIDKFTGVLILFSFEPFLQKQKNLNSSLRNFKKLIFDLTFILKKNKFKNINLFYFFSNELVKLDSKTNNFINNSLKIIKKVKKDNISAFNLVEEICLFDNKKKFFDSSYWKRTLFPFNGQGQKLLSTILYIKLRKIFNRDFKIIILDADNTLWNGILDERGFKGIKFIDTKKKIDFLTFHKKLKTLISMGFILALSTKNDLDSIKKTFKYHAAKKILKLSDFALIKANWEPKYININSILKNLNLSIDNAIFIDDSDFEINAVNNLLPRLETFNFYKYENLHAKLDEIIINKNTKITDEDKKRTKLYSQENKRSNEKNKFKNYQEYLKSLKIKLFIKKNSKKNTQRLSQLTLRTNQFNSTALRLSVKDIKNILSDKNQIIYECSAEDNFGDYGIIALAIISIKDGTPLMKNILMSCRAIGREIENYFVNFIVIDLKKNYKIDTLNILYNKSEKNNLIKVFFNKNFHKIKKSDNYYCSTGEKFVDAKSKLIKIYEK